MAFVLYDKTLFQSIISMKLREPFNQTPYSSIEVYCFLVPSCFYLTQHVEYMDINLWMEAIELDEFTLPVDETTSVVCSFPEPESTQTHIK